MSESTPPTQQDQVEQPNPLEIFWEKHRRKVTLVSLLVLAGLLINYGLQYMERQKVNATWNSFAKVRCVLPSLWIDGGFVREIAKS